MQDDYESLLAGAKHILESAGSLRNQEEAMLIFDDHTMPLVEYFDRAALELRLSLTSVPMKAGTNHGEEPALVVANMMKSASLVIALTTFSLAHSRARIDAAAQGARFLSLPQYSKTLLGHPMVRVDYRALAPTVRKVSDAFTAGSSLHITSEAGTDLTVDISGRAGNYCPAFVEAAGDLGSPPDIEANVSPIEISAHGIAIVDGSITHPTIGLLSTPVKIVFRDGLAVSLECMELETEEKLKLLFDDNSVKRRVLAEVGVGLNPLAELTGAMLSDEGTLGTAHLGLGSNSFVGGKNEIDFHLDFVMRDVTVEVDGSPVLVRGVIKT